MRSSATFLLNALEPLGQDIEPADIEVRIDKKLLSDVAGVRVHLQRFGFGEEAGLEGIRVDRSQRHSLGEPGLRFGLEQFVDQPHRIRFVRCAARHHQGVDVHCSAVELVVDLLAGADDTFDAVMAHVDDVDLAIAQQLRRLRAAAIPDGDVRRDLLELRPGFVHALLGAKHFVERVFVVELVLLLLVLVLSFMGRNMSTLL